MTEITPSEITRLLTTVEPDDRAGMAKLLPLVYAELRALADR